MALSLPVPASLASTTGTTGTTTRWGFCQHRIHNALSSYFAGLHPRLLPHLLKDEAVWRPLLPPIPRDPQQRNDGRVLPEVGGQDARWDIQEQNRNANKNILVLFPDLRRPGDQQTIMDDIGWGERFSPWNTLTKRRTKKRGREGSKFVVGGTELHCPLLPIYRNSFGYSKGQQHQCLALHFRWRRCAHAHNRWVYKS